MPNYYNEFDPFTAQWLRNLITAGHLPPGEVDARSIMEVHHHDLRDFTQCHFFAGIGGWPLALHLARWDADRPVWTGSCPCQPFSVAGRKKGKADQRHLWPIWFRLIREQNPTTIFGEQVTSAITHGWMDEVAHDLETYGYAIASAVLPACSVGAWHQRDRLWFVANNGRYPSHQDRSFLDSLRIRDRLQKGPFSARRHGPEHTNWWASEPGVGRVADGLPARVGRLRAYGNAIVPQVAAEFVTAFMECEP